MRVLVEDEGKWRIWLAADRGRVAQASSSVKRAPALRAHAYRRCVVSFQHASYLHRIYHGRQTGAEVQLMTRVAGWVDDAPSEADRAHPYPGPRHPRWPRPQLQSRLLRRSEWNTGGAVIPSRLLGWNPLKSHQCPSVPVGALNPPWSEDLAVQEICDPLPSSWRTTCLASAPYVDVARREKMAGEGPSGDWTAVKTGLLKLMDEVSHSHQRPCRWCRSLIAARREELMSALSPQTEVPQLV